MVIFGFVWILIAFFFKMIFSLIGLLFAIPLLFIVSSIVMVICGALILGAVILGVQIYEWHTGDEIADMDDDERTY